MPSFSVLSCIAGFLDSPCKVKCTDEVIHNSDFPHLGFLVCVVHFDAVNELS